MDRLVYRSDATPLIPLAHALLGSRDALDVVAISASKTIMRLRIGDEEPTRLGVARTQGSGRRRPVPGSPSER